MKGVGLFKERDYTCSLVLLRTYHGVLLADLASLTPIRANIRML
jgi:hypothetical protein